MYFFRKKNPDRPVNTNIRIMHAINVLAICLFLGGIIWKLVQWLVSK